MKRIGAYLIVVLIITILLPMVIVKAFSFVPKENIVIGESIKEPTSETPKIIISKEPEVGSNTILNIKLYNSYNDTVEEINLEEYVKGVVSAEMPADTNFL